jgi:hypothetical protein
MARIKTLRVGASNGGLRGGSSRCGESGEIAHQPIAAPMQYPCHPVGSRSPDRETQPAEWDLWAIRRHDSGGVFACCLQAAEANMTRAEAHGVDLGSMPLGVAWIACASEAWARGWRFLLYANRTSRRFLLIIVMEHARGRAAPAKTDAFRTHCRCFVPSLPYPIASGQLTFNT